MVTIKKARARKPIAEGKQQLGATHHGQHGEFNGVTVYLRDNEDKLVMVEFNDIASIELAVWVARHATRSFGRLEGAVKASVLIRALADKLEADGN